MKSIKIIILLLLIPCLCSSKTLWKEENNIYSTRQKYKIGHTLKVIFNEKTLVNYQVTLSEDSKKTSTLQSPQGQMINFLPGLSGGDNFKNEQKSSTKNKGELSKNITAQVTGILDNGNLQISGKHTIQINDTYEQVSIQGIVNPDVIKDKKSVYSTDILEPTITYKSYIIKADVLKPEDYIQTFSTNVMVKASEGQTNVVQYQTNITSQYNISEQKKNELILKYLNRILSVLFTR